MRKATDLDILFAGEQQKTDFEALISVFAAMLTELKKVANLAEIYYMHIAPHCAIGPVALAAALHVDAVVPNFLIQEQIDASLGDGLLYEPWLVRDGHIDLPTRPGLGFEIDEHEAEQNRAYQEELGGEFYYPADGSVADW